MAKNKNNIGQWSLALLRVMLGVIFTYHGYAKLFVPGGLPGTAQFFQAVGIPLANYAAVLVAFTEFIGGILLLLGFLTRLASLALVIEMLVALFKVHLSQGFFISPTAYGYEFVLLIIVCLVVVLASGPGKLALSKMMVKRKLLW